MLYRRFSTQEEIDQQYDPARSVDAGSALARYQDASRAARAQLNSLQSLAFGPTLPEYLDLFSAKSPNAPLHVFFHGGYWRALSSKEFAFVAHGLVPAGVTVAVVNYALCPQVSISEIVRQCRAALAWLYGNAADYDYDPERITISGHSAGGQIVGMLLATDWAGEYGLSNNIIKGAVAISGLFDLTPFPYSWLQPKLQLGGREVTTLSPLFQSSVVDCPVVVAVGELESEEFHRQSRDYVTWLEQAKPRGSVCHLAVPGTDHFSVIGGLGTGSGPVFESILGQIE
ncbi:alpha/beta hydrolase [Marinobacter changyiensis]|uniref:alpha/beta hydrolase n=1 Tax=Marinobacter changyiensis TaxID=2604091 RepID=UPI001265A3AA|nr:alpha/beta hydrolase [Marinobacter changyiensis]